MENELIKGLTGAVKAAVELRIVTYVGNVPMTGKLNDDENPLVVTFPQQNPGEVVLTSINLVQGDIVNVIPPNFDSDFDKAILAFHAEQVKEGKAIVARNLELLANLGKQLVGLARAVGPANPPPANPGG